jgi:hypothetical protein
MPIRSRSRGLALLLVVIFVLSERRRLGRHLAHGALDDGEQRGLPCGVELVERVRPQ